MLSFFARLVIFSLFWLRRAFVFAGFRCHFGVRLSAFFLANSRVTQFPVSGFRCKQIFLVFTFFRRTSVFDVCKLPVLHGFLSASLDYLRRCVHACLEFSPLCVFSGCANSFTLLCASTDFCASSDYLGRATMEVCLDFISTLLQCFLRGVSIPCVHLVIFSVCTSGSIWTWILFVSPVFLSWITAVLPPRFTASLVPGVS